MSATVPVAVVAPEARPEMRDVQSSMAAQIGYDESEQLLYVRMKPSKREPDVPGPLYRYPSVSQAEFDRLLYGESVGKFIHALKTERGVVGQRVVDTELW